MHVIKLDGYNATPENGEKLELGTFDSFGEEQLQIVKAPDWVNLSVIATFNPPNRKPVQAVVDSVTGVIKVPKEATAGWYGVGTIVFVGIADGVQRISSDVEYIVRRHSNASGTEPAEPTPSVVEQILTEAQNANVNSAEAKKLATDAKDIVQSVRTDADNGKFNGKDGAKGDKGDNGTTPQLKIGEDNLWHVSYDNGATWVSLGVKATGVAGKDGKDGLTPHIGENGNWWVGDTDTGVSAKGPKGDTGPQGPAGEIPEDYPQIREDVSKLKEDTTALQKRQNVLVGSETGNPVSCNDAFAAPLCGLTVYGKSTQKGTPSPDNPVPIVSAGDGGSITMKVTGKNLYHAAWTGNYSESGLLLTATSTTISIKGTATKETYITRWLIPRDNPIPLDPNKRYTFTPKLTGNVFEGLMVYTYDEKGVGTYTGSNIPARSTGVSIYYQKKFKKDETIDFEASIQLEIGTEATVYEPYREQLLTLPTPNGLPGIPVTSGGNYTDQNGQQWVCDEVDLERGVKVQRVKVKELSPNDTWSYNKTKSGNNNFQTRIFNADVALIRTPCFCNILKYTGNGWDDIPQNLPKIYANDQEITASFPPSSEYSSLEVFKQLLTNVKSVIYYGLATPIETPLTPAEIAAYKALTAYAPDTVVQASDGAGIKLDYQRDVNLVVKKLEDAIASMTIT